MNVLSLVTCLNLKWIIIKLSESLCHPFNGDESKVETGPMGGRIPGINMIALIIN